MVFSVVETYALYFLAFSVFKIDQYPFEMIFSSLIMAFFSYILRETYDLTQVDLFLQYFLLFCFLWMLFRINLFYAAVMTGFAYQAYASLQTITYLVIKSFGSLPSTFGGKESISVYLLQLLTALFSISIGHIVQRKRKGFDFVPDKQSARVKIGKKEIALLLLNIPSLILVSLTLLISNYLNSFYIILPMIYVIFLFIYLRISYQKDRCYAENDY